jgi:hypothetical protein
MSSSSSGRGFFSLMMSSSGSGAMASRRLLRRAAGGEASEERGESGGGSAAWVSDALVRSLLDYSTFAPRRSRPATEYISAIRIPRTYEFDPISVFLTPIRIGTVDTVDIEFFLQT